MGPYPPPKRRSKVGEEVEVEVISIDEEKRNHLSIRRLQEDPWQEQIG